MAAKGGTPRAARSRQRGSQSTVTDVPVTERSAKAAASRPVIRRGTGSVTPYLAVADAAVSLAFYAQAFGFKPGVTITSPQGKIIHAVMRSGRATAVMFSPEGIWSGTVKAPAHSGAESPITMYVRCLKVDALADRARAAGAMILTEPSDMFWGERITRIKDPDGYIWCFACKIGEFDPAKMPSVSKESADSAFDIEF